MRALAKEVGYKILAVPLSDVLDAASSYPITLQL